MTNSRSTAGESDQEYAARFRAAMRLIVGNVSVITAGIGTERSGLVVISMFNCELDEMIDRGTHSIIIGSVVAVQSNDVRGALTHWRGQYRPLLAPQQIARRTESHSRHCSYSGTRCVAAMHEA